MAAGVMAALISAVGAPASAAPIQNPDNGHWYELIVLPDLAGPTVQDVDWQVARNLANAMAFQGMRGRLAVILSSAENDFLTNTVIPAGPSPNSEIWTGGRSFSAVPGDGYVWVDGTPFGFTNWNAFDLPDDADTTNGACSEILTTGEWEDSFCVNDGHNAFLVEFVPVVAVPANSPAGLALIALLAALAAAVVLRRSSGPGARG